MSDTEYISVTETAKLIRAQLKAKFPGIKFSVRSDQYAGGASINVGWMDGPLVSQVDAVIAVYAGGGFDGMIDMAYCKYAYLMPDGSATFAKTSGTTGSMGRVPSSQAIPPSAKARKVRFLADYVHTSRKYSAAFYTRAAEKVCKQYGIPLPEIRVSAGDYAGLADNNLKAPDGEYLSQLIYRELYRRTNFVAPAPAMEAA